MGVIHQVLTAMRPGCVYRIWDIANICHIETDYARQVLISLETGGMIEATKTDEYRRKKLFTTKQDDLFR